MNINPLDNKQFNTKHFNLPSSYSSIKAARLLFAYYTYYLLVCLAIFTCFYTKKAIEYINVCPYLNLYIK